jgi:hypothetical protein
MKKFDEVRFSASQCRDELSAFGDLLDRNTSLLERQHLKPFFEGARQLSAFIGTYAPDIGPASLLAYEFEIGGDFIADIVVGNRGTQTFCMVELEDAMPQGIFTATGRSTTEWSRRFEHGFSQLVDWFYALADLDGTENFSRNFGYGHSKFNGLLVIGRSGDLSDSDYHRLKWREERVLVDSHPIYCVTYDELRQHLSRRLADYTATTAADETKG